MEELHSFNDSLGARINSYNHIETIARVDQSLSSKKSSIFHPLPPLIYQIKLPIEEIICVIWKEIYRQMICSYTQGCQGPRSPGNPPVSSVPLPLQSPPLTTRSAKIAVMCLHPGDIVPSWSSCPLLHSSLPSPAGVLMGPGNPTYISFSLRET